MPEESCQCGNWLLVWPPSVPCVAGTEVEVAKDLPEGSYGRVAEGLCKTARQKEEDEEQVDNKEEDEHA